MGGGDYHSLVAKGALRLVRTRYVGVCRRFPRCIDCGIAESAAYAMHGEGPMRASTRNSPVRDWVGLVGLVGSSSSSVGSVVGSSVGSSLRLVPQSSFFGGGGNVSFARLLASSSSAAAASAAADAAAEAAAPQKAQHVIAKKHVDALSTIRNIGISAHIDSGKTTLTERVLFYTGRIRNIHEVRGKDGVGAKMDSMELEREKGITIQSAATFCKWKDTQINIIDTPGHVDFTVEVERALRVLDGAILVLCSVGGVQSQSITVDRQMKRYNVPRLCFVNKCDRAGADPFKVIGQLRTKLRLNAAAVQYPIGLEDQHEGHVDLVKMCARYFDGAHGETVREEEIPANLMEACLAKRHELIEAVADVDEELGEVFLADEDPSEEMLHAAINRATRKLDFAPVFLGSAFKNKGVQALLDGVTDYLPSPLQRSNVAIDNSTGMEEQRVALSGDPDGPLVSLAFKLEEGKYGQLTYVRIYEGTLKKGMTIHNIASGKKVKVPRLVRTHSDELEDVDSVTSGEIAAVFGMECSSGDTFTDGSKPYSMESIHIQDPVMSLAISPTGKDTGQAFTKALQRFQREDPTFRVHVDKESGETIISGMGELHLDIYAERMRREYKCDVELGKPRVNFRETITQKSKFEYQHKKQSGGSGQYAKISGYIEPITEEEGKEYEFLNSLVGNSISESYVPAVDKGVQEAMQSGPLIGYPMNRLRFVLEDGAEHSVDSSELAFKLCAIYALREAIKSASPVLLEPLMSVEVVAPVEFQGAVVSQINRRKGVIMDSEQQGDEVIMQANIPLNNMFGYSSELRSATQGKGEFSMEYLKHAPVPQDVQDDLVGKKAAAANKSKQ
ncbi:elongation factor G-1, mitochondrial [Pycnococcus provasolii]|uniref:Elongation factor G, mitochondrial n=1 Tax=Pycnococcus provasolii TaxID=41880 RepID=A0A830HQ56_9CHLO|nr:elongation factor G-1, mitochondrial [Pycnococcus provasolii]